MVTNSSNYKGEVDDTMNPTADPSTTGFFKIICQTIHNIACLCMHIIIKDDADIPLDSGPGNVLIIW